MLIPVIAYGDKGNETSSYGYGKVGKIYLVPGKGGSKKTPSYVHINYYYYEGVICFEGTDLYDNMCVTVTNEESGEAWFAVITNEMPTMEVSIESGCYSIVGETDSGQIFVGSYEL